MTETRRPREPRRRDQQGDLLPVEHPSDYSRYAMGDRDPAARAAKAAYRRGERARDAEAAGRGPLADEDIQTVTVPVRLNNQENPVTFRLSTREAAVLDRFTASRSVFVKDLLLRESGIEDVAGLDACARALGKTRSRFIRDTLLEELGIKDTAKRRKPRRREGGRRKRAM